MNRSAKQGASLLLPSRLTLRILRSRRDGVAHSNAQFPIVSRRSNRARRPASRSHAPLGAARQEEGLHRRRGRHDGPPGARPPEHAPGDRDRVHRPGRAQGRGRAQGGDQRRGRRRALPARRRGRRGRVARRRRQRRQDRRRLHRAPHGPGLGVRLPRARRGAARPHRRVLPLREPRVLPDGLHRPDAALGRRRPPQTGGTPRLQRRLRLQRRRQAARGDLRVGRPRALGRLRLQPRPQAPAGDGLPRQARRAAHLSARGRELQAGHGRLRRPASATIFERF